MTPADLRSLLAAATPGPWKASAMDIYGPGDYGCVVESDGQGYGFCRETWEDDARLCASLRNLAPLLLDLWEAVEKETIPDDEAVLGDTIRALEALREAKP